MYAPEVSYRTSYVWQYVRLEVNDVNSSIVKLIIPRRAEPFFRFPWSAKPRFPGNRMEWSGSKAVESIFGRTITMKTWLARHSFSTARLRFCASALNRIIEGALPSWAYRKRRQGCQLTPLLSDYKWPQEIYQKTMIHSTGKTEKSSKRPFHFRNLKTQRK